MNHLKQLQFQAEPPPPSTGEGEGGGENATNYINEPPWPEGQGFFRAHRLRRITPLRSGHHSSPGLKAWGLLGVL